MSARIILGRAAHYREESRRSRERLPSPTPPRVHGLASKVAEREIHGLGLGVYSVAVHDAPDIYAVDLDVPAGGGYTRYMYVAPSNRESTAYGRVAKGMTPRRTLRLR